MRVVRLECRRFRGFEATTILPVAHVVLVGEPGCGRSDLVEALDRALSTDSIRSNLPTELDFFEKDLTRTAEVEIVLGDLGSELEQVFLDALEVWDMGERDIVQSFADPETIDRDQFALVVRLCYRARWDPSQEHGEHWIDYPKFSDPDQDHFERVSRADRAALQFHAQRSWLPPLELARGSGFRRILEGSEGEDFSAALNRLEDDIGERAREFSATSQMSEALEQVLAPLRETLRLGSRDAADVVKFLPQGGSLSGLVRSLAPSVGLGASRGELPLRRHGSTLSGMLSVAQAIATAGRGGVVAVDDFGEGLDSATTHFLAATLRRGSSQCWLSTRRPHAVEAFLPSEIVRLTRDPEGRRSVHYGKPAASKSEIIAARHLSLQLLPAVSSCAVIIVEGPSDAAAMKRTAARVHAEAGGTLPSAHGVSIIDAGAADASGGVAAVARLSKAARELGFRTVALIDHDGANSSDEMANVLEAADVVVQFPDNHAIERALLSGVSDEDIRTALTILCTSFDDMAQPDLSLSGSSLATEAIRVVKRRNLHGELVDALPRIPALVHRALQLCIEGAVDMNRAGLVRP